MTVTHIHDLFPESLQSWAHLLWWVARATKPPDALEGLVKVLLITIPEQKGSSNIAAAAVAVVEYRQT